MPESVEVHGAGKPGTDYIEIPTAREQQIAALLDERRGYAVARAAGESMRHGVDVEAILGAIDEQLRSLGGEVPEDVPVEPAAPVRGRRGVTA